MKHLIFRPILYQMRKQRIQLFESNDCAENPKHTTQV